MGLLRVDMPIADPVAFCHWLYSGELHEQKTVRYALTSKASAKISSPELLQSKLRQWSDKGSVWLAVRPLPVPSDNFGAWLQVRPVRTRPRVSRRDAEYQRCLLIADLLEAVAPWVRDLPPIYAATPPSQVRDEDDARLEEVAKAELVDDLIIEQFGGYDLG